MAFACIHSLAHQLHPASHNSHHRSRLHHLAGPSSNPVLNLCQPLQPGNHDLCIDLQLCQLLHHRRDDVGQRQSLRRLQGVDGVEAARHVRRAQERLHNLLDGFGLGCRNAVVNRLCRNRLALDLALGRLGLVL